MTPPAVAATAAARTQPRERPARRSASERPAPAARPAAGRSSSPRIARRVSGPASGARHPAPRTAGFAGGAIAAVPLGLRVARGVATLPDHRIVDTLVRGRWWIGFVGFLLIGIVAMQVSLLKLNAGIGASVQRSALLERTNGELRASVSRLGARERVQAEAERIGLVMPAAGDVHYIGPQAGRDAPRAAQALRSGAFGTDATALVAAAAVDTSTSVDGTSVDGTATDGTSVDGTATGTDPSATDATSTDQIASGQ